MRDILIVETSNLDILTGYFTGRYTAYLDYIQYADEPDTDKKRFVLEVMNKLDPLVNKMESELLSIYVDKYRTHKPFTFYANNLAQQAVINSLNKKLNKLVQGIKRPQIAFKCQLTHQALQA
ncbi:hypothetical protein [Leuconostoc mesenteroides]|uniref:hypothetical protein n=1 Tax=Leuconostoc mesenteroides TaxID=1245 RepID=UPI000B9D7A64|nr:hypothetical protein [Leuconostoc mesenteroides]BAX71512.1 hypothetical protein LEMES_00069 [Leuconostoc mesenteroides]